MITVRRCYLSYCRLVLTALVASLAIFWPDNGRGDEMSDRALEAARRATRFLVEQVAIEGGYLWAYSADLSLREGEGIVKTRTVWVQPPGTPAVGEAFVRLYEATGDPLFLEAAKAAADVLRRGQMRSGGWQASIELEPERRRKWAYRVDPLGDRRKDQSSLDDDKTQSALRFLIQLDRALDQQDAAIHEMVMYGLEGLLERGQFRNGGFPQVWTDRRPADGDVEPASASFPDRWQRTYAGHQNYWFRYTLNDHLAQDLVRTLFLADTVYQDSRYRVSAIALADSLLRAQMPDPQPAWAQQYNERMEPCWARKFEPPAIVTSESFGVLSTLMDVYQQTGESRFLESVPRALDYLERCELPDGRLARFYELRTNRPLFFNRKYELTYQDDDVPTHYAFHVTNRVDSLRKRYDQLMASPQPGNVMASSSAVSEDRVRQIIDDLDDRGAWLVDKPLRYHQRPGPMIDMRQVVRNLQLLADYLDRNGADQGNRQNVDL